ncbi:MAG: low specificity L-threonine aldolase, partial [Planctomycetaceae bacterium]
CALPIFHALEYHVDRMVDDHANARTFAEALAEIDGIRIDPDEVESNLVFFEIDPGIGDATQLAAKAFEMGVKVGASGSHRLRACTHLDVDREQVIEAAAIIGRCVEAGVGGLVGSATGPYSRG